MHPPLWFILIVLYEIKHYTCDFIFQSHPYFLGKFRAGWDFVLPLLAHTAIHALGTFLITIFLVNWKVALCLSAYDMIVHTVMDRIKASPNMMGRWHALTADTFKTATPAQKKGNGYFWLCLGFDQAIHNITHASIIWYILR